jgi:hypothetical protein
MEKGESIMPKENLPPWIQQFWYDTPTVYTKEDIFHLEPNGLTAVFLKILALNSDEPPIVETELLVTTDGFYMISTDGYKICVRN